MAWIPAFAGMTLLRSDATQGWQNGLPLFVIPDLMLLCEVKRLRYEARVGNPGFLLPPLAA